VLRYGRDRTECGRERLLDICDRPCCRYCFRGCFLLRTRSGDAGRNLVMLCDLCDDDYYCGSLRGERK
jgi:hypothetical protein